MEKEIEQQKGDTFPQKMLNFFKQEDDKLVEEVEESLEDAWGNSSSEEEDKPASDEHHPSKKSQQINGHETKTFNFGNDSEDELDEFNEDHIK